MKKFENYFCILVLLVIEVRWKVQGSADFNVLELEHLSKKLQPHDCKKLLEELYLRTPAYEVKDDQDQYERSVQLNNENCLHKLEEWNQVFPGKENKRARENMAEVLQSIGRVDLANYIRRSKRLIELLPKHRSTDAITQAGPSHKVKKKRKSKKTYVNSAQQAQPRQFSRDSRDGPRKFKIKTGFELENPTKPTLVAIAESSDTDSTSHVLNKISTTFWIAFILFVLLVLSAIIIIGTVIICKNRNKIWGDPTVVGRGCDDHCRLLQPGFVAPAMESGLLAMTPPEKPSLRSRRSSSFSMIRRWSSASSVEAKKSRKQRRDRQLQTVPEKKHKKLKEKRPREKHTEKLSRSKPKEQKKSKDKPEAQDRRPIRKKVSDILAKDPGDCSCCACPKAKVSGKHVCPDDGCKEQKIRRLTDLYPIDTRPSMKSPRPSRILEHGRKKEEHQKAKERKSTLESTPRTSIISQVRTMFKDRSPRSPRSSSLADPCTSANCSPRRTSRDRSIDSSPRDSEVRKSSF